VFLGLDRRPLSLAEGRRAFKVAKRLAGIRDELSLYSIRHTFASWLAIQGQPLRTIQELLGPRMFG
jgi:site-specific recombinase XerD